MSDTATQPTPDAPEAPAQEQKPETDWKAQARKWEQRARENSKAAERLAEIEEANKSEAQKTAERLAALEQEATDARREAMRLRIATRYSIGDEDADLFLTASDEETLTKQAERLAARTSEQKKQGNHVPREGSTPSPADDDERATARAIFGP